MNIPKVPKTIMTIEVHQSNLTNSAWGWPINPDPNFANYLDGMSEGTYRVNGKRRYQPLGHNRRFLCRDLLGIDLEYLWQRPIEFQDVPLFEWFYASSKGEQWFGARTCEKLLEDIRKSIQANYRQSEILALLNVLQPIFTIGADTGLVQLQIGS
ncbi:MAG: hypothetical protein AAGD25_36830 [Cyanobacteria bacterium P01_F01_bin.150]